MHGNKRATRTTRLWQKAVISGKKQNYAMLLTRMTKITKLAWLGFFNFFKKYTRYFSRLPALYLINTTIGKTDPQYFGEK